MREKNEKDQIEEMMMNKGNGKKRNCQRISKRRETRGKNKK